MTKQIHLEASRFSGILFQGVTGAFRVMLSTVCLLASVALLLCMSHGARAESQLELKLINRYPSSLCLYYGKTLICPAVEFYVCKANWRNLIATNRHYGYKTNPPVLRGNKPWKIHISDKKAWMDMEVRREGRKLVFTVDYTITDKSEGAHVVADIFLNHKIFYASQVGKLGKIASTYTAKTPYGTLVMTPLTKDTQWELRDVSDQAWRVPENRTLTLLTDTEKKPFAALQKRISYALEFIETPEAKLEQKRSELKTLADKSGNREVAARLQTASTVDELQRLDREITAEIRKRKHVAAPDIAGLVIPQVQQMSRSEGVFVFPKVVRIKASAQARTAGEVLMEELRDYRGLAVAGTSGASDVSIAVDSALKVPAEGYVLQVRPQEIELRGKDQLGCIYGVQTLIQLMKKADNGTIVAETLSITDFPERKFRALQLLSLGGHGRGEFLRRAVGRLGARYKYNVIVFGEGGSGTMEFKSHPEVSARQVLPIAETDAVVNEIRRHGLQLIIEMECLGHSANTIKAHPDWSDGGDKNSLCLRHPQVKRFLADQFDEIIDRYHPTHILIGGDEVFSVGKGTYSKGVDPADLVADHMNWCRDYLKKRQVETIVWHDMLLENGTWKSPANSRKDMLTHPALDKLKKDIIIDFWCYTCYHPQKQFPEIKHFMDKGFQVIGSPWYDSEGALRFHQAIKAANALGTLDTTWILEGCLTTGMMTPGGVDFSWNGKDQFQGYASSQYEAHAHEAMLPPRPSVFAGTRIHPLSLEAAANKPLVDCTEEGPLQDLSLVPDGEVEFSGIPFRILPYGQAQCVVVAGKSPAYSPVSKPVPVNGKALSLIFLHAMKFEQAFAPVGFYEITYQDGTSVRAELFNRKNISGFHLPTINALADAKLFNGLYSGSTAVWHGLMRSGKEAFLHAYEWRNPYPDKPVKQVTMHSLPGRHHLVLVALSAVKN